MSALPWYWPHKSEKECWLAAISLLYESRRNSLPQDKVEYREDGHWYSDANIYRQDIDNIILDYKIRPVHKNRIFAELYEEGQKWQVINPVIESDWSDFAMQHDGLIEWLAPQFADSSIKYQPHPELEPELYKKFMEMSE